MTTTTAPLTENRFVSGEYVRAARDLPVEGRAIVVNTGTRPAWTSLEPRRPLPAFSSTILVDTTVSWAESLVVLKVDDEAGPTAEIVDEPEWVRLGDVVGEHIGPGTPFPVDTPLWKGPQDVLDVVEFDPGQALGGGPSGPRAFELRANLWFAPAGTDCGIHVLHDFIEVHTQVVGVGRMQKFRDQDHATLVEDVVMGEGYTTPVPFCGRTDEGGFVYPWHQYRADTDCVWLALEYHQLP
ncbi:hypothetical protein [Saccharothrix luteola]|uniref:hypothetical protein n=1 Tax=Saccharothrix luteola TaxID=2893018 RepID=UPI001E40D9B1|nr:hypothetical protein [Saccharothrix luteola]MCC8249804.1 hypothetical protein [Saccharothrix luteola]